MVSLNWDHLRYFLALAKEKTLVGAGRSLEVSHTTVLRRIKLFEQTLGVKLFEQTGDGQRLSAAGEALYAEVQTLDQTIGTVTAKITDGHSAARGEVTITTTDTLAHEILPPLLYELSAQYEGLNFSLKMINGLSDIDNYEADIAIRTCLEPPGELIGRQVGAIQFVACASKQYVQSKGMTQFPNDVAEHRFIILDASYQSTPFYQWLDSRLSNNSYRTEVSNFLCAAALARAGMGITVLPYYMLENQSELTLLSIEEPVSSNPLWILSHPDSRDTERVKLVRRSLYEALVKRFALEIT